MEAIIVKFVFKMPYRTKFQYLDIIIIEGMVRVQFDKK